MEGESWADALHRLVMERETSRATPVPEREERSNDSRAELAARVAEAQPRRVGPVSRLKLGGR